MKKILYDEYGEPKLWIVVLALMIIIVFAASVDIKNHKERQCVTLGKSSGNKTAYIGNKCYMESDNGVLVTVIK